LSNELLAEMLFDPCDASTMESCRRSPRRRGPLVRGLFLLNRGFRLCGFLGRRENKVYNFIQSCEFARLQNVANFTDSGGVIDLLFEEHQPKDGVDTYKPNVPCVPGTSYLGFQVAGVLAADNQKNRRLILAELI
jgi:hypothetical protein